MYNFLLGLSPNQDIQYVINLSLGIMVVIQAIVIAFLYKNTIDTKNRLFKFMPQNKSEDVEALLVTNNENMVKALENQKQMLEKMDNYGKELRSEMETLRNDLNTTNTTMKNCVQKFATVRYNPFAEVGGDFCYAVVLLDDHDNGVLINSIYAREGSYSYAKEILDGKSSHKLSEDEKKALNIALSKK